MDGGGSASLRFCAPGDAATAPECMVEFDPAAIDTDLDQIREIAERRYFIHNVLR